MPRARNGPNVGLTQINAGTAQSLGYTGEASGLLDAETNLRYGLKYLAQAYKLAGGDTCGDDPALSGRPPGADDDRTALAGLLRQGEPSHSGRGSLGPGLSARPVA